MTDENGYEYFECDTGSAHWRRDIHAITLTLKESGQVIVLSKNEFAQALVDLKIVHAAFVTHIDKRTGDVIGTIRPTGEIVPTEEQPPEGGI